MNKIIFKIVHRLINSGLIEKSDEAVYSYRVEVLLLKLVGILLIGTIGVLSKKYLETFVFYLAFSRLRAYTNGYHSKNYALCLLQSAFAYILICEVFFECFIKILPLSHLITFISMAVIYALAPVNSDAINLSKKEIVKHRKMIKKILIIYSVFLPALIHFKAGLGLVVYFEMAIMFDMLLVVVGKVVYKDCQ
ncbi:MAG: accessory gene regulator B family protein [Bacillota bacterium]|nr:accessory gene regulator B family protein [Bacillota bacterium]